MSELTNLLRGNTNVFRPTVKGRQTAVDAKWVGDKLIGRDGRILMQSPSVGDVAMEMNSFMPVTGDIQSGVMAANDLKNKNYGSAALNGLGLLPFVPSLAGTLGGKGNKLTEILKQKTKYEIAHELAQKNAVEMLGLPANNTAMERAKALGFDTPAYHGTKSDITAFDKNMDRTNAGFWFGEAPTASKFAMASRDGIEGGENVMPVLLKQDNPMTYEAGMGMTIPEISKYAKSSGYDSVNFNGAKSGQVSLVQEPYNIRSRFAAFDPARAHEADLLGAATPEMMGLLGLLSGSGIIYAKNKKDNKK